MLEMLNHGIIVSENSKLKIKTIVDPDAFIFKKVEFEGVSFICQKKFSYLVIDNSNSKEGLILLFQNKPRLSKSGVWDDAKGEAFEFLASIDLEGESVERIEYLTQQCFEI